MRRRKRDVQHLSHAGIPHCTYHQIVVYPDIVFTAEQHSSRSDIVGGVEQAVRLLLRIRIYSYYHPLVISLSYIVSHYCRYFKSFFVFCENSFLPLPTAGEGKYKRSCTITAQDLYYSLSGNIPISADRLYCTYQSLVPKFPRPPKPPAPFIPPIPPIPPPPIIWLGSVVTCEPLTMTVPPFISPAPS